MRLQQSCSTVCTVCPWRHLADSRTIMGMILQASEVHNSFAAMTFSAETLVKNASQTEKTITAKDFAHLNNLSPSVTLHQDAFTLGKDIEGEEAVKKYLAAYFDKYDFTHETLGYAVNEKSKASFALAYDKVRRAT